MNPRVNVCLALYRRLASAYPHEFRMLYGEDLDRLGEDAAPEAWRRYGVPGLVRLLADIAIRMPAAYLAEYRQDMAYALRMLAKAPGFTAVAVLSLGVGIGMCCAAVEVLTSGCRSDPLPRSLLVLDAVPSPLTRVMYARALDDFFAWWTGQGRPPFTRATVQAWRAALEAKGLASARVNQKLSALRKLAAEAAYNGLLDPAAAQAIRDIRGAEQRGVRTGNWLTKRQTEALLAAPDATTNQGKRDRAILAVLVGCGLRRDEAIRLALEQIQQRDGRWCVVDLVGKGRYRTRYRTVPMPAWTKTAIDSWATAAGLTAGPVFRGVNKGDVVIGDRLSTQGILRAVTRYADAIAPHDLRRTFAKLAFKGGAKLDQIQLSLGHVSIQTTERYLGVPQDLTDAPCDYLHLKVE